MKKIYKYLLIIIPILVIIIGAIFIIKNNSSNEEEREYKGWRSGIERSDYMNISDFAKNKCNKKYYSPTFQINKDNILEDYNNEKIGEEIFTISTVTYGKCDLQLLFVTALDGSVFYVNNLVDSEYQKYKFIDIDEVREIIRLDVNEEGNIIAFDKDNMEIDITEQVKAIVD